MKREEQTSGENKELRRQLAGLNLTIAAAKLDESLSQAQIHQLSYSDFLSRLLAAEEHGRFERKLARSLKRSRLGAVKSLDEFDFSVRRKLSAPAVKELLNCQWIVEGRSVLCIGRSSTGKTHVAKALGYAACMKGYSILYANTVEILDDLHASFADNTYRRTFQRYEKLDLLIFEEFGCGSSPMDRAKADYLFRLVSARHPIRSMIVVANTGFENWQQFFPSHAQAIATIDRLIDRATILRFTGKGFRKPRDIFGDALDSGE